MPKERWLIKFYHCEHTRMMVDEKFCGSGSAEMKLCRMLLPGISRTQCLSLQCINHLQKMTCDSIKNSLPLSLLCSKHCGILFLLITPFFLHFSFLHNNLQDLTAATIQPNIQPQSWKISALMSDADLPSFSSVTSSVLPFLDAHFALHRILTGTTEL